VSDTESAEIKFNLASPFTDTQARLGLMGGKEAELYFLDDLTPGIPQQLPLLHNGVVLRIRAGSDKADSTVKLRPCRRSQLRPRWVKTITGGHHGLSAELTAQQDWSGERHTLAVSAVTKPSPEKVKTLLHDHPGKLFNTAQRQFLTDCGGMYVNPEQLVALGPIKITRWKELAFDDFELNAERWQLGDLDVVEVSVVTGLDQATLQQVALHDAITAAGLTLRTEERNKTETFLAALAQDR
jgi:hypothetical protein